MSPLRRPLATAFLAEARRAGLRVVSLADDGLHSLRQGFDELLDATTDADPDAALARAVRTLHDDGATVALVCCHGSDAIALSHHDRRPRRGQHPWGADILVDDLNAAWRVVHTIPRAREVRERAISLASGASLLGSLMLIPGVHGHGPTSVNVTALFGLWRDIRWAPRHSMTPNRYRSRRTTGMRCRSTKCAGSSPARGPRTRGHLHRATDPVGSDQTGTQDNP